MDSATRYDRTTVSPVVDDRGFIGAAYDGALLGIFFARFQRGAARGNPGAPPVSENRIYYYQRLHDMREGRDNARWSAAKTSQAIHDAPLIPTMELNVQVNEGVPRVSPATPTRAANDMLLDLQLADGLCINSMNDHVGFPPGGVRQADGASTPWQSWANEVMTYPPAVPGQPSYHPGWLGYGPILRILKRELREFLVVGNREFDLGFHIVDPAPGINEDNWHIPAVDWGIRTGWVQRWRRTNHLVLQARNRVYLIVTRSQDDHRPLPPGPFLATTFEFVRQSLLPATVTQLWPPVPGFGGPSFAPAPVGSSFAFTDTIVGIDARLYRIDLN